MKKDSKQYRILSQKSTRKQQLEGFVGLAANYRYAWESESYKFDPDEVTLLQNEELACRLKLLNLSKERSKIAS